MDTNEEIEQLKKDLREAQSNITELRIALARKDGVQTGACWWFTGIAAMIAAWLGVTSLWQIPTLVRATAAGQAEHEAKQASESAKLYEEQCQNAAKNIPSCVHYGDHLGLIPDNHADRSLTAYGNDGFRIALDLENDTQDKTHRWMVIQSNQK